MRVAFVHGRFPAGGAERITIDIARYLKGVGGYEIYVYATRIYENLLSDDIRNALTVRKIPSQAFSNRRTKEIERLIVQDGINVLVQVTKSIPGIDGIRRRTGCKAVVACHGEPLWQRHAIVHRRQKGFLRRIAWQLYNKRRFADGSLALQKAKERTMADYLNCDAYTVLCDSYRLELAESLGIHPGTSHIYAIENPERAVADICFDKENMILFCGRFENWSKRIDRLLRIWAKVQYELPDWKLVLVGNGPAEKMLRQMAQDLKLERISFEGHQTDVAKYYRKASVVALTSQTEGWPLTLSEAQAHGCIGVAFGCTSGVKEILFPDGECGFIVPPYDEDAYAETLLKVAALDQEQERMIRTKAVDKRLQYVPEVIAEKWRFLFETLLKK
jgi:glycosyltransferase involved in cell wall biosynthesis